MKVDIRTTWDSDDVDYNPIHIELCWNLNDDFLTANFSAPFYDDPESANGLPGEPCAQLWDYEVVELFFLAEDERYLEVEVSPHGQHLVLLLNGRRNIIKDMLPMNFSSSINPRDKTWNGIAKIPLSYFPPNICKFNAYAIHGSGEKRVYEALFPVPKGKFDYPDFHRLEYFTSFELSDLFSEPVTIGSYWNEL